MKETRMFSVGTELQIRDTCRAFRNKMRFDAFCELLKLGMISEKEFVRRAQMYIEFNPERPLDN